jgi:hypothetical protein
MVFSFWLVWVVGKTSLGGPASPVVADSVGINGYRCGEKRSESQGLDRGCDETGIGLPVNPGNIDEELDVVAVRIAEIEAVADGVVARAEDRYTEFREPVGGLTEVVVGVPDLQTDVVQALVATTWLRSGVLPYLNEEELVVGPATRERGDGATRTGGNGFVPAQDVMVERGRFVDVSHVKHHVP